MKKLGGGPEPDSCSYTPPPPVLSSVVYEKEVGRGDAAEKLKYWVCSADVIEGIKEVKKGTEFRERE